MKGIGKPNGVYIGKMFLQNIEGGVETQKRIIY